MGPGRPSSDQQDATINHVERVTRFLEPSALFPFEPPFYSTLRARGYPSDETLNFPGKKDSLCFYLLRDGVKLNFLLADRLGARTSLIKKFIGRIKNFQRLQARGIYLEARDNVLLKAFSFACCLLHSFRNAFRRG